LLVFTLQCFSSRNQPNVYSRVVYLLIGMHYHEQDIILIHDYGNQPIFFTAMSLIRD
jgi:hypothetical protein